MKITLESLNIDKAWLNNEVNIEFGKVYKLAIYEGISKNSLNFNTNLSDTRFPTIAKILKELNQKFGLNIHKITDSESVESLEDNTLYIDENCTVIKLFNYIRNSVAHRNYLKDNQQRLLMFSVRIDKKQLNPDTVWKKDLNFILCILDASVLVRMLEYFRECINLIH